MLSIRSILRWSLLLVLIVPALSACDDDDDTVYSPRPRGYFRIQFPEKTYRRWDSLCPYSFDLPVYARIEHDGHPGAQPCWINIVYPQFNAKIHISYKEVHNDLATFLDDSRDFAIRHQIKATGMEESPIVRDSAKVYGLVYDINGNTASSLQFYLTDSTQHFLRGALYFNSIPNIDSTKIVVDYIRKDVVQMIQSFRWKK